MITARCVTIAGAGGVEVLSIGSLEVRAPGAHEVLIEVAAAGLNRADVLQRRGFYPAPPGAPADVPGLEYAGTVAAVGEGVTAVAAGDRVMGITAGGAMATHLVAHERELCAVPDRLSLEEAAAVPEVYLTAYDALFSQGGLGMGERVLVHAVGSGVGTAALQLARVAGARVVGTSRTRAKLERCAALGLAIEDGVEVAEGRFSDEVRARFGDGADLVLDTVGAAYLEENLRALAPRGRLVLVGLLGGATAKVPLATVLARRLTVVGTVLRSRPLEEKVALVQRFARCALPSLASGACVPVIDCVLPMAQVAEAHQRMESNESFGKIVLRW